MGRIMGLDVGSRWIGVSVSDPTCSIARGIEVLDRKKHDPFQKIAELVEKYGVKKVVIGLPMDTRGGVSQFGEEVLSFGKALEKRIGIEVVFVSEVYTTKEAERIVGRRDKRKLDLVSSEIILQSFLDGAES